MRKNFSYVIDVAKQQFLRTCHLTLPHTRDPVDPAVLL